MTVKLKEGKLFLKKKHELADLLNKLDSVTNEAVDLLVETMQDTKVETKVRVACADKLLDYKVKVSEAINRDELNRQIAEIKANGLSTPLIPDGNSRPAPPRLDMHTIQEV